jgi:hypothetical protein
MAVRGRRVGTGAGRRVRPVTTAFAGVAALAAVARIGGTPSSSLPLIGGVTAQLEARQVSALRQGHVWNGHVWNGSVWNGSVWNGSVWNGSVWNGSIWN